jgi:hypothetical protein
MDKKVSDALSKFDQLDDNKKKILLKKVLERLLEENFNEINEKVTPDRLKKTYELFTKKYKFKVGDIVKWKPGFNHRKLPRENEPAIVIEVLDNPIIDPTDDVGSPYYNEQYDIKLGIIHPDGRFLTFYYDSARFEPYREE